jgi:hypothetical protein
MPNLNEKLPLNDRLLLSSKKWSPLPVGLLLQEALDRIKELEWLQERKQYGGEILW